MNRTTAPQFVIASLLLSFLVGCKSGGSNSAAPAATHGPSNGALVYDVRKFGARGDGAALDSPAINKAIDAASSSGGGTVYVPAGTYRSFSIRLKSNVALYLDQNATILAADNPLEENAAGYDPPESNDADPYEDFGHSHWHNSLIWGENLENISILGPGRIDGKGLTTGGNPRARRSTTEPATQETGATTQGSGRRRNGRGGATSRPHVEPPPANRATTKFGYPGNDTLPPGIGNKAIALKLCRNVILKDFTIFRGGHFGILATGVDNFTLDNLKIDTNRDGMDIDCCRNVHVSNCSVNSPGDDGICPKSSYALGEARPCENMTITNCQVSGWAMGSMLDGTFKRRDSGPGTGRIKMGTESNGGFKNITISNCVFAYCRGLALEAVDGALLEDVSITNITMRDIGNSPIFMRLGSRLRGPDGTQVGAIRRINISNVICWNAAGRLSSIISGIPGHDIEDVRLSNIHIYSQGAGTPEFAATQPSEKENAYPEPTMFGPMPAYGFFVRHVKGLQISDVNLTYLSDTEPRPPFVMEDVKGLDVRHVRARHDNGVPVFKLTDVSNVDIRDCQDVPDTKKERAEREKL